jgi:hypothetical protein
MRATAERTGTTGLGVWATDHKTELIPDGSSNTISGGRALEVDRLNPYDATNLLCARLPEIDGPHPDRPVTTWTVADILRTTNHPGISTAYRFSPVRRTPR